MNSLHIMRTFVINTSKKMKLWLKLNHHKKVAAKKYTIIWLFPNTHWRSLPNGSVCLELTGSVVLLQLCQIGVIDVILVVSFSNICHVLYVRFLFWLNACLCQVMLIKTLNWIILNYISLHEGTVGVGDLDWWETYQYFSYFHFRTWVPI